MAHNDSRKLLRFHVEAEDYFGTLATVLDLLRQRVEQRGYGRKDAQLLEEVREDLMHLQEGYGIIRRGRPGEPGKLV